MKSNFKTTDESLDDVLVTEEQIAAKINYDIDKKPITALQWILCSITNAKNST